MTKENIDFRYSSQSENFGAIAFVLIEATRGKIKKIWFLDMI